MDRNFGNLCVGTSLITRIRPGIDVNLDRTNNMASCIIFRHLLLNLHIFNLLINLSVITKDRNADLGYFQTEASFMKRNAVFLVLREIFFLLQRHVTILGLNNVT